MQNNTDELQKILIDILRIGLLRTRALAADGHSHECFIEAHHLHNLPGLIKSLHPESLQYYWNIERPEFIKQAGNVNEFQLPWQKLAQLLDE